MEEESEGYSRRSLKIILIVIIVVMILLFGLLYWRGVLKYIMSKLNLKFFVD